jgi:hypothetical protein
VKPLSLSFVLLCAAGASAQTQSIKITDVFATPDLSNFDVIFDQKVATSGTNLDLANLTVNPSTIKVTGISPVLGNPKRLRVTVSEKIPAGTEVKVKFTTLESADGKTLKNVSGLGTVQTFDDLKAAFLKMQQAQKKSDEKSIFASGFVTTASTGTQGGADISVNPDLGIKGMTSFLQIKKSTQTGADAKNFEGGVKFRSVFPTSRAMFEEIGKVQNDPEKIREIVAAHQKNAWSRLVAGSLFDLAAKLEGQATAFEVTNFVGDSSFQWRTRTRMFIGNHGYWRGFLMPAAMEGGKNIGAAAMSAAAAGSTTAVAAKKVDWLARYKGGLGMTFYYENWNSEFPIRRVDLDANGVFRQLFLDEYMYDAQTKMSDHTGKGGRGYGQIDFKVFAGQTDKGRYGIKLSYNRGSLPPAFARVKSFQFGFLWESNDQTAAKQAKQ